MKQGTHTIGGLTGNVTTLAKIGPTGSVLLKQRSGDRVSEIALTPNEVAELKELLA